MRRIVPTAHPTARSHLPPPQPTHPFIRMTPARPTSVHAHGSRSRNTTFAAIMTIICSATSELILCSSQRVNVLETQNAAPEGDRCPNSCTTTASSEHLSHGGAGGAKDPENFRRRNISAPRRTHDPRSSTHSRIHDYSRSGLAVHQSPKRDAGRTGP